MIDAVLIDVEVTDPGWDDSVPQAEALARRAAAAALAGARLPSHLDGRVLELGLRLSDDAELRTLNRDYRHRDKPTNVLAFALLDEAVPASAAPVLLGDVVVSRETMLAEARSRSKPAADHLSHLVVHGVLHLVGYDHQAAGEADIMEAREIAILAQLGVPDPYALDASTGQQVVRQ